MRARDIRRAGAGLTVAAALLAGCAAVLPQTSPDPVPTPPLPVLEREQVDSVLAAVAETLAAADEARDGDALAARVENPALAMRTAQYLLADRSGGSRAPTPLTTDDQILVVGATDTWPRTVMAVTQPPEGATVPLLLVLRQEEPRAQFKLWTWARLFPGVETPALASPEVGSAEVAADAEGLAMTPAEAIARYADVLEKGDESEHGDLFDGDPFRSQIRDALTRDRASVEGIATIGMTARPVENQVVALATADGGAVVVGAIRVSTTYTKTLEGSTLVLGGEVGDWLDSGTVPSAAAIHHDTVVALVVPAPADDVTVPVVGAERVLVDVSVQ